MHDSLHLTLYRSTSKVELDLSKDSLNEVKSVILKIYILYIFYEVLLTISAPIRLA